MNKRELIKSIYSLKNPEMEMQKIMSDHARIKFLQEFEKVKGDPGYTPQKGVDYFTASEVSQIISFVISEVRKQVRDGIDGRNGKDGQSGSDGRNGKDGQTPVRGIHYFTKADIKDMVNQVAQALPKHNLEEILKPHIETIGAAISKIPDHQTLVGSILADPRLRLLLHGAGGSTTASITPVIPTSGDIDDSNTDFVFASKPKVVVVNGVTYRETKGWTWTAGTLTVTLDYPIGTGGDIYAFL